MKRPLQLSLAIALALGGTNAFALGLGTIHVNSRLNQPLDAEIPVLQGTQGEAEGLLVQLAAAEDFDRVGLNRSRLSVPLEFSLVKGSRGESVIKVTSKEVDPRAVPRFPRRSELAEGPPAARIHRAARSAGHGAARPAPPRSRRGRKRRNARRRQPLPEAEAESAAAEAGAGRRRAAAAEPRAGARAEQARAVATPAPKRAAASGEYTGRSRRHAVRHRARRASGRATNINQLMLALLKQNPNAFYKDNINALKRGAILRIPSADQVKAIGSASEAAAQVHAQIEDWRGGAAAKPTLVADTGTRTADAEDARRKDDDEHVDADRIEDAGSERLELVPPKAGKDSVAMADRPGSGARQRGGNAPSSSPSSRAPRKR